MTDTLVLQIIAFFVATAMAIMSSHFALIRLKTSNVDNADKAGVLYVVEFALVILIGAPIPIVTKLTAHDQFTYAAWLIPLVILILTVGDLIHWGLTLDGHCYYYTVAVLVILASVALLVSTLFQIIPNSWCFFSGLGVSLFVIVAQFLKSALRFAK